MARKTVRKYLKQNIMSFVEFIHRFDPHMNFICKLEKFYKKNKSIDLGGRIP